MTDKPLTTFTLWVSGSTTFVLADSCEISRLILRQVRRSGITNENGTRWVILHGNVLHALTSDHNCLRKWITRIRPLLPRREIEYSIEAEQASSINNLDFRRNLKNNETTFCAFLPWVIRRNSLILRLLCFATNKKSRTRAWEHKNGISIIGDSKKFALESLISILMHM